MPKQYEEGSVTSLLLQDTACTGFRMPLAPAPADNTMTGVASGLLDGHTDQAAPLGPRAVVILDVHIAEHVVEHKPRVAAALAHTAVRYHPLLVRDALALVKAAQLRRSFAAVIGLD